MSGLNAQKRPAVEDDDDDITDRMTDEESVTPNSDSRKKPRLSIPVDDDEESMGSMISSDDIEMDDTQNEPITQSVDELEDISYQSLNDAEAKRRTEAEQYAAQNADRISADNAIIEEVQCENFMCHGNLTIKIGPLINFIIGHNGSGKSAVLTALTICLGGKAAATNRAGSLKAFIKEGRNKCTLSVKIKNQGPAAYKPELYGPTIIVQRYFTRSGTSGYNLKSSDKKVVSTKRDDLDDLLDYFMLQLDNPMNVLTQDMARQFLNSSSPADKYKFFQKGTQLERLDADYRSITAYAEQIEVSQTYLAEMVTEAKAEYEKAKKDSRSIELMQKTQEKINLLSAQMCWVQVEAQKDEFKQLEQDLIDTDNKIAEYQVGYEGATEKYKSEHQRYERLKDKKAGIETEIPPLVDKTHDLTNLFQANRKEMQELQIVERDIHGEITACQKLIAQCTENIKQEKDRLEVQSGGRSNEINAEIEVLRSQIEDAKHKRDELMDEKRRLASGSNDLREKQKEAKNSREARQNQVDASSKRIKVLEQGGGGDNMSHEMRQLLSDINKESRFREKPVGPMWQHVFLKEQKWSSILETSLSAALDGFCVTSKHDQDLLAQILKKYNNRLPRPPKIFIGNSRPIDTTAHEPPTEFATSLRVLKIDNDLVRNTLIINQAVDQTILIFERDEAVKVNLQRLRNVKQIFCYHDDQKYHRNHGHRLGVSSSGDPSISPVKPWMHNSRMQADLKDQIAHARLNLEAEASDLQAMEKVLWTVNKEIDDCRKEHTQIDRRLRDLVVEIQKYETERDHLEDEMARLDENRPSTLPSLEAGLKEHNESIAEYQQTLKTAARDRVKLGKTLESISGDRKEVEGNMAVIQQKLVAANKAIMESHVSMENELIEKNTYDANKRTTEIDKERLLVELEQKEEEIVDITEQALDAIFEFIKVREEVAVPSGATEESLHNTRQKLIAELERAVSNVGGTVEQLKEKELVARDAYDEIQTRYNDGEALILKLRSSLDNRIKRWKSFREHIAIRASGAFTGFLAMREFRGRLDINHQKKELALKIEPDITKANGEGRVTKTLSGGEKSFSTICLLLALWESLGSPIRCLDEFDVFMDAANRGTSIKMIIAAARTASTRQFIFITPQSMDKVPRTKDVTIQRMGDPERGQTTIELL